jgi:hypothetical protein
MDMKEKLQPFAREPGDNGGPAVAVAMPAAVVSVCNRTRVLGYGTARLP